MQHAAAHLCRVPADEQLAASLTCDDDSRNLNLGALHTSSTSCPGTSAETSVVAKSSGILQARKLQLHLELLVLAVLGQERPARMAAARSHSVSSPRSWLLRHGEVMLLVCQNLQAAKLGFKFVLPDTVCNGVESHDRDKCAKCSNWASLCGVSKRTQPVLFSGTDHPACRMCAKRCDEGVTTMTPGANPHSQCRGMQCLGRPAFMNRESPSPEKGNRTHMTAATRQCPTGSTHECARQTSRCKICRGLISPSQRALSEEFHGRRPDTPCQTSDHCFTSSCQAGGRAHCADRSAAFRENFPGTSGQARATTSVSSLEATLPRYAS